ncbi:MAG: hypothetical protein AAB340_00640 [Patescibacteria group bacterium]
MVTRWEDPAYDCLLLSDFVIVADILNQGGSHGLAVAVSSFV